MGAGAPIPCPNQPLGCYISKWARKKSNPQKAVPPAERVEQLFGVPISN